MTRNLNRLSTLTMVCLLGIVLLGCGAETGPNTKRRIDTGLRSSDLGPSLQPDGGPIYLDGAALAPDTKPIQSTCPAASAIAGSYSGTYKGTVTAGLPFNLTGTLSFQLVASGTPDEYTIQNGKLQGAVLGLAYSLPMQGKVVCGTLDGAGTGDVSGVKLQGTYKATWVPGGFPSGSWAGQDVDKKASGSGTWEAKKK